MPHPQIEALFTKLDAEVREDLRLAAGIKNPGLSGAAREAAIRKFLSGLIPDEFSISTGLVIDALGGISSQVDIVIYRNSYHPLFNVSGVVHYMAEAVAAVIENKAAIDSAADLSMALNNIASVKRLDRSNAGRNYRVVGTTQGTMVNRDHFNDQTYGAVLTERSMSEDSLIRNLTSFLESRPRREWPNAYVDVSGLMVIYFDAQNRTTDRPTDAVGLCVRNRENGLDRPVAEFGAQVANLLRVASLIDFRPTEYLLVPGPARKVVTFPTSM